jgi:murein DD-endopeptidase MepM/ murein hydrolase activator NlpD
MRSATLALLPLLLALTACAPINGRPNGWGAPGGFTPGPRVSTPASRAEARGETRRGEEPPARPAVAVRTRPDARSRIVVRRPPASSLLVPVVGVEPGDLHDSFHSPRSGGRTHHAIDIAAPTGTPILAVTDGAITRKHWNTLGGNTLYLRSADGRYDYYYAHLDSYTFGIEVGATVRRGDVLGTVGATGNAQGPHLHFQVLELGSDGRGTPVNPYDLLRAADLVLVP